ncbi:hypothetical protein J6590_056599 [Homalodisca vitripennis]|nr:hypothetical protein J6590_089886 [Homalodisca vitripennis]KAG8320967.1 hypothetical protein J6590_056599 [Homalodisca vitripennis]
MTDHVSHAPRITSSLSGKIASVLKEEFPKKLTEAVREYNATVDLRRYTVEMSRISHVILAANTKVGSQLGLM